MEVTYVPLNRILQSDSLVEICDHHENYGFRLAKLAIGAKFLNSAGFFTRLGIISQYRVSDGDFLCYQYI